MSERSLQVEMEVDEIMQKYDDGSGTLDFDEFQLVVQESQAFKAGGIQNSLEECGFLEATTGDIYRYLGASAVGCAVLSHRFRPAERCALSGVR